MQARALRKRYGRSLFGGGEPAAPGVGASVKYKGQTITNHGGKYMITAPVSGLYKHSKFEDALKEAERTAKFNSLGTLRDPAEWKYAVRWLTGRGT